MKTKTFHAILLLAATLALSGCWTPEDVVLHEPGEYKGAKDNLSVDAAAMQERISLQMDR